MPSVDIRNLGVVEYTDALELMSTLQQQRINNEIPDTILFLEHPEIVTVGPRARNDGIAPPSDYRSHPVDRGGGLTWHGPGQLVVYPIIHWNKDDEKSVADIISKIESSLHHLVSTTIQRQLMTWLTLLWLEFSIRSVLNIPLASDGRVKNSTIEMHRANGFK